MASLSTSQCIKLNRLSQPEVKNKTINDYLIAKLKEAK
jgi:hypothetical protein